MSRSRSRSRRTISASAALACLAAALLFTACSRSVAPPATPSFTVPGAPSAVYDAILPEIRDRIARDTKIVRIDSGSGALVMRFSAYLEDHSVRLVEVGLSGAPADPAMTSVAVLSHRFSFLPGRSRDTQDATLESSLAGLIVRRTSPPDSTPPR